MSSSTPTLSSAVPGAVTASSTRLLLLLIGAGVLLLGSLPAVAAPLASPSAAAAGAKEAGANSPQAVALLGKAARAARTRGWTATQYVSSWYAGKVTSDVLAVSYRPGSGTSLRSSDAGGTAGRTVPAAAVQERLLAQLAATYVLTLAADTTCGGRPAHLVELRRHNGQVAGRLWLDSASGLALRREAYDGQGRRLRSTAYVDLVVDPEVAGAAEPVGAPSAPARSAGEQAPAFPVPPELPGGFVLFDASRPASDNGSVLRLAYSDGLSTVAVFSQPGSLGSDVDREFVAERLGGGTVFVRRGSPERLVWRGAGQVFTLVGDAGHEELLRVARALPHDARPRSSARFGRGLARVGSWVNPFG